MMGKMKEKTKKKTTKRPELSRGVFYAMAFLCLASTITACTTIFGGGWFNDSKDNVSVPAGNNIDAHYTLMKCHQLGSNTFSCKIVQGKNIPLPDKKDVPIVEMTKDEDESKVEKENKTKNWNPFE